MSGVVVLSRCYVTWPPSNSNMTSPRRGEGRNYRTMYASLYGDASAAQSMVVLGQSTLV